jgi:hypothetical protein
MLNRGVVSLFSFLAAVISAAFFLISAWLSATSRVSELDGAFLVGGWLMAAVIFAWRSIDPEYLNPLSIVKGR